LGFDEETEEQGVFSSGPLMVKAKSSENLPNLDLLGAGPDYGFARYGAL